MKTRIAQAESTILDQCIHDGAIRETKIVCTIGPASSHPDKLRALIDAGMNVARLNMSHGKREEHAQVVKHIRSITKEQGREVAILLDLSGPKIRLGELAAPVELDVGDVVELTTEKIVGHDHVLPVEYPYLVDELDVGDELSLFDGLIRLEVTDKREKSLIATVHSPGEVSSRKGVHLPTGGQHLPAMNEKDETDLRLGIELGVDWIALSFVKNARDIDRPRRILEEHDADIPILAKIERRPALEDIDAILETFDGIMVARGDLGVEIPLKEMPGVQKRLIAQANRVGKPVITATQMLLSMVESRRPTRAEVTDVANAILDGTDAVMLSEETAVGHYPVETVRTMAEIALSAEAAERSDLKPHTEPRPLPVNDAISRASGRVATLIGARLIVTPTTSGSTARLVARYRPQVPVLALGRRAAVVRELCLTRGVLPRRVEAITTTDFLIEVCRREALASGLARPGDTIVITAGHPLNVAGTTNLLQVVQIKR